MGSGASSYWMIEAWHRNRATLPGWLRGIWEVLCLMVRGQAGIRSSKDLSISPHTVRNHVRHSRQKLAQRPSCKPS